MELDLSHLAGYVKANEWVRNHVVLGAKSAGILQLNVTVGQNRSVVLFMWQEDGYILGFRGADRIYVLEDAATVRFVEALKNNKFAKDDDDVLVLKGFKATHAGLNSFPGGKPRDFILSDLERTFILSQYSYGREGSEYSSLKPSLSLLVSIISEAARHNGIGWNFQKLYAGEKVSTDEVFNHWDHAKQIIRLAREFYPPPCSEKDAIFKLARRAEEIGEAISSLGPTSDLAELLRNILQNRFQSPESKAMDAAQRLRTIARELGIEPGDAGRLTEIKSAFSHEAAVRAARTGVCGAAP